MTQVSSIRNQHTPRYSLPPEPALPRLHNARGFPKHAGDELRPLHQDACWHMDIRLEILMQEPALVQGLVRLSRMNQTLVESGL